MKTLPPILALLVVGCSAPPNSAGANNTPITNSSAPTSTKFSVTSSSFQDGGAIPPGKEPPKLQFQNLPPNTKSIAIQMIDPDAGNFVHWLQLNVDPQTGTYDFGASGKNSSGDTGYFPPEPPPGETHHYHIRVFALDDFLKWDDKYTIDQMNAYIQPHTLGQAEIVGTYKSN